MFICINKNFKKKKKRKMTVLSICSHCLLIFCSILQWSPLYLTHFRKYFSLNLVGIYINNWREFACRFSTDGQIIDAVLWLIIPCLSFKFSLQISFHGSLLTMKG